MSSNAKRFQNRNTKTGRASLPSDNIKPRRKTQAAKKPLEAKTEAQKSFINAINVYDIIFAEGVFGTGKTYIAAIMAADALVSGVIDRIIITRPAVDADEEYGFLPGELDEKWAPYFAPVRKILEHHLGAGAVEMLIKLGKIEIAPLGHLRGHTFNDCWVLLDEAQNTTPKQMKLFLSRIGENAKLIIDGDLDQMDIQGPSGFEDGINKMKSHNQVGYVRFEIEDIVRSGLAKDICIRYAEDKHRIQWYTTPAYSPR